MSWNRCIEFCRVGLCKCNFFKKEKKEEDFELLENLYNIL